MKKKIERVRNIHFNSKGYQYEPAILKEDGWAWHIEYYVWDHEAGELKRKRTRKIPGSSEAEKRKSAKSLCKEINKLLANGYMVGKGPKKQTKQKLTILQAMKVAADIKRSSAGKKTSERYKTYYNVFEEWAGPDVGKKFIHEMDRADVLDFLDWLKQERDIANYTRNNYLQDTKACLYALVDRGYLAENPASGIKKLPVRGQRNVPYTQEQQEVMEAWMRMHDKELYYFTRFIYHGFLRPVEICRLKRKHIDLASGIILTRSHLTKNKKQMPVAITLGLMPILEEMGVRNINSDMHLFSTSLKPGFKEIHRNYVTDRHAKAMKRVGLNDPDLTMYSWKHTGNCNAYRAGADIKALQAQNRHSSLEMTDVYLRSMGLRQQYKLRDMKW